MREDAKSEAFDYVKSLFSQEDSLLREIQQEAEAQTLGGMSLNPVEAKTLHMLIKLREVKSVVEIGTFLGYSALWMARALPLKGKIYTLEKDEKRAEQAKSFLNKSECANSIEVLSGDASESLQKLSKKGPFDMVFIDANKGGYGLYLDWAEKNVREGGLIVGDNTFLFGAVYGKPRDSKISQKTIKTMREFNQRLANSDKFESILLPTYEGMTIAIKK